MKLLYNDTSNSQENEYQFNMSTSTITFLVYVYFNILKYITISNSQHKECIVQGLKKLVLILKQSTNDSSFP